MTLRVEEERGRIRAAMARLLNHAAERSNGSLNVSTLATEAQIMRQRLYEYHSDLLDEFRASSMLPATSPDPTALQRQIRHLQEQNVSLAAENDLLQDKIRTLAAIIAELTHEATFENSTVVTMPRRRPRRRSDG
jgi:hypothetical protein